MNSSQNYIAIYIGTVCYRAVLGSIVSDGVLFSSGHRFTDKAGIKGIENVLSLTIHYAE